MTPAVRLTKAGHYRYIFGAGGQKGMVEWQDIGFQMERQEKILKLK
jgi:hypothetical protein